MHIKTRPFALIYRFSTSVLSVFATWLLLHIFGNNAWRLFPTWIMSAAVFYYVCSFFTTLLAKRRSPGRVFCPALQSVLVISSILMMVLRLVFDLNAVQIVALEGAGMALIDFVLPLLFLLDWILFTKKGFWRVFDPLYSLALVTCYTMGILLSAEFLNSNNAYRYPYAFLDFSIIGLDVMFAWFALISAIILSLGYICFMIDFIMSGKLAKHIVLPHIKTIIVEEEVDTSAIKEAREKPEKTSKLAVAKTADRPSQASPKASATSNESRPEKTTPPSRPASKPSASKATSKTAAKTATSSPVKSVKKPTAKKKPQPVALLKAEAESVKRKSSKK